MRRSTRPRIANCGHRGSLAGAASLARGSDPRRLGTRGLQEGTRWCARTGRREPGQTAARTRPVHALFPSQGVPIHPEITAFAQASFPAGAGVFAGAADMMTPHPRRLRLCAGRDPRRDADARRLPGPRRGSARTSPTSMIAGLRRAGPAPPATCRVYHAHDPDPRARSASSARTRLTPGSTSGAGPDLGWIGFDPTNALLVGPDHIVLAFGRGLFRRLAESDGVVSRAADRASP